MANKTNTTANSIKFNVTFGVLHATATPLPANAAVLLRKAKRWVNKEQIEVTEFMAVEGVKRTSGDGIILPLLALMVADAQERNGFAVAFKVVKVGSEEIETKLTAKSTFTRWLNGNVVYKTDSQGNLKSDLTLDDELLLKHTALNVKKTSPLLTATGDALAALMKTTAKAIGKQATLRSAIFDRAETLYEAASEQPAKPAKPTTTEKAA